MKRFVALVLSTFVLFAAGLVSFAAPVHSNSPAQWHATAVLTNTDTGEKSFVPINLAESSIKKTSDSSQCFTEEATVYFKVSNSEIQQIFSWSSQLRGCCKIALWKNNAQNPELFRIQNGSKRVPGFLFCTISLYKELLYFATVP